LDNEKGYDRLSRVMARLREADQVPWSWVVDHVRSTLELSSWTGLADFAETVRNAYRKNYWAQRPCYVEIFTEKDAIAGVVEPVTEEHDVRLRVCRGYVSLSVAHEIADLWVKTAKPIFAYYLGDFDPSGFDIERDLQDELRRYSKRDFPW